MIEAAGYVQTFIKGLIDSEIYKKMHLGHLLFLELLALQWWNVSAKKLVSFLMCLHASVGPNFIETCPIRTLYPTLTNSSGSVICRHSLRDDLKKSDSVNFKHHWNILQNHSAWCDGNLSFEPTFVITLNWTCETTRTKKVVRVPILSFLLARVQN
jgi:hypothetical protein